jgi:ankyrin repeat protein
VPNVPQCYRQRSALLHVIKAENTNAKDKLALVEKLFKTGAIVPRREQATLLKDAVRASSITLGQQEVPVVITLLKPLIQHGADVNAHDLMGETPLMIAAMNSNFRPYFNY